jgi:SAM-dependent methyltransferase
MEDQSLKEILWEKESHGKVWKQMHRGYFSTEALAKPLLKAAEKVMNSESPDAVVDLGGGTGFVPGWLKGTAERHKIRRINLDLSTEQLAAMEDNGIEGREGSIADFLRSDLGLSETDRVLWISRSSLHYFGQDGLDGVLKHLYAQMRPGEWFIHQSACFEQEQDAQTLTRLYHMMGTEKWYPSRKEMRRRLEQIGFEVMEEIPAPPLGLASDEVMVRYHFGTQERAEMIRELAETPRGKEGVFEVDGDDFMAYLHYFVFCGRVQGERRKP